MTKELIEKIKPLVAIAVAGTAFVFGAGAAWAEFEKRVDAAQEKAQSNSERIEQIEEWMKLGELRATEIDGTLKLYKLDQEHVKEKLGDQKSQLNTIIQLLQQGGAR